MALSFDLTNIGFPTFETEQEYNTKTKKKSNPYENIGFGMNMDNMSWGNQKDNVGSSVWNYNDPFGFSGKPKYRNYKGKRRMVKQQRQQQMSGFDILNFDFPQTKQKTTAPKKSAKSSQIINRPKGYVQREKSDNVLVNTIGSLNERLSRRAEQQRFNKSQPNAPDSNYSTNPNAYVVSGTDDKGRGFQERYGSANVAYSAEQKYRSKGYNVNTIIISGKGRTKKPVGRIPTRLEILANEDNEFF